MTKDIIEQESLRLSSGIRNELHLYREGTFLRAYDWSAWLACRYLHEFKVNKRQFKGIDAPVAYIGFPDTRLAKWLPEGVEQSAVDDKHLQLLLPEQLLPDPLETMQADYERWKESVPLALMNSTSMPSGICIAGIMAAMLTTSTWYQPIATGCEACSVR